MPLRPVLTALFLTISFALPAHASGFPVVPSVFPPHDLHKAATVSQAPKLSDPGRYLTNTETRTFTGSITGFRAFLDRNPITDFVVPTDAIPAIEDITYLSGTWPQVGSVRRVHLAGGHSVLERVLTNTKDRFSYQIWDITAPAGRVISYIMGEFRYAQDGNRVTVTWDYNIKPNLFLARPAINRFLKNDFSPFMEAGLSGVVAAYTD
ncbi:SRPBCC family protein [uncultured Tateyamaria sp.]|uniref:SRPBCC family protein n=1 Tax=uncultured Tateyamaria sp. TaxID=455651 RepID=UPI002614F1FA|nr:SRPBCC family protein [uncultured Tateyamaria sp.]